MRLFSGGIRLAGHSLHFPAAKYRYAIKEGEKLIALGAAVTSLLGLGVNRHSRED